MVKFLPTWRDSQKPLISVWKYLGCFSVSSGNKIGLICRYSQDSLSIGFRSCCSHCWECTRASSRHAAVSYCLPSLPGGSPGLSTSFCLWTGSTLHMQPPPFLPLPRQRTWNLTMCFSFHGTSKLLQEVDLLFYYPKFVATILLWLYQQMVAPLLFCSTSIYIWCQTGFW